MDSVMAAANPGRHQDGGRAAAGDDAKDDAENIDQSILAAEDHVTQ